MNRVRYLLWALSKCLHASTSCPACGSPSALVRRKYVVTALRECPDCLLRFRTPKDDPISANKFYIEEAYKQGFTTDLPSDRQLEAMMAERFARTEQSFGSKIEALHLLGLKAGARILDFGSSWGYGSWQMRAAGFDVFSYEIGRERRRYAKEKLGCNMIDDLRDLHGSIDCLFAAHVIEHLPDPGMILEEAARLLNKNGMFVCYCPNGSRERELADPTRYHQNWGVVHPVLITPSYLKRESARRGLGQCTIYSSPIDLDDIRAGRDGALDGGELLAIITRGNFAGT